jgi:hypothetical protein
MNFLKMLFGSNKPETNKIVLKGSLSFKEQIKQDIIPTVWQMVVKEKEHLNWLIDNSEPQNMVEISLCYLNHFIQRHKEYIEYADGL